MMSAALYVVLYAIATGAGLPLGFTLFGRRHPAGWIAGLLFGYALSSLAVWLPIAIGQPHRFAFIATWTVVSAVMWALTRGPREGVIALPAWRRRDTAALAAVLALTAVLSSIPLAAVGTRDADGNRYYRAYFNADFVWHTALTAELARFAMPPRNPYLATRPIHYYWTYFLVPAVISEAGPSPLRDVQLCLKCNAFATGLLLVAAVFIAAWIAVPHAGAAALGVAVAVAASSAEGIYALWRLWSRGIPLNQVSNLNIDAISAWWFDGHRIDGLQRCLWYVPQHSMAYALGLIAIAEAAAVGSEASVTAIVLVGVALGASALMNPFVGGVFALAWGAAVTLDAIPRPAAFRRILTHAIAAIPVTAAIIWCAANRMVEGAGGALQFGFYGASTHHPILSLLLSLGPALALAAPALFVRAGSRFRRVLPALTLAAASLLLMFAVRLDVDHEWVPFRAGQMLLVAVAVLAARWIAREGAGRAGGYVTAAALVIVFAIGLPTTVIDAYNARDVHNLSAAPGFRWTLVLTPAQQHAFEWIRKTTPRTAIVQMEPVVRAREGWSLVPSFAERRMAAGLPISLLRVPEYAHRSDMVQRIYSSADASEAWRLAHELHIRYLYVDDTDRAAYPGAAKFDTSPAYFVPIFRERAVGVYAVQ